MLGANPPPPISMVLPSHLVAFSLLSAKTCVSHTASHPPFASPDPVIAWRRRNQLSPDVVSALSAARRTKDEPGDDARLIAEPRSEARNRKRLSAGSDRFDQTPESRSHVCCSVPTCSTSTCIQKQIDPHAFKFICLRLPSTRQSEANHRLTEIQDIYIYIYRYLRT